MKPSFFQERVSNLERKLTTSTFRQGVSAHLFGIVVKGYSDHLPIRAEFQLSQDIKLKVISWTLLADDHLYNNFMNITGTQKLFEAMQPSTSEDNIYGGSIEKNKLYYFFSELATFLYSGNYTNKDVGNEYIMNKFILNQPSRLTRSRDEKKEIYL